MKEGWIFSTRFITFCLGAEPIFQFEEPAEPAEREVGMANRLSGGLGEGGRRRGPFPGCFDGREGARELHE